MGSAPDTEPEEPDEPGEATYSVGAVSRLTGLSGHVLRAWERRYGAVEPLRTAKGTRRYRESDVARLQLLRGAVDAGHPIGSVAKLADAELRRRAAAPEAPETAPLRALLEAVVRLDADEVERRLGLQLAALGPRRFITLVASPLMREVGDGWAAGRVEVAAEHMATSLLRNALGGVLRRRTASASAPPVVFATPSGERHELGALIGAVIASEAGGNVVFLGPELPVEEIASAARRIGARAVALGFQQIPPDQAKPLLAELRGALPPSCEVWIGGATAAGLEGPAGVEYLPDLEALERRIALLTAN